MPETTRQLAAIMFTDIVGYTSLMGKDSAKALELVRVSKDIQKPLVEKHNGKWLKEMGDGSLSSFNSALDAVNCSIEIQESARAKFDGKLRIGIHLGDITIEEGDVYGDGVNVASRLESIADPGGIYISDAIEKAIRGQTDVQAKYLGEVKLKNVSYGVRTYALQGEGLPAPSTKLELKRKNISRSGWIYMIIAFLVISLSVYFFALNNNQLRLLRFQDNQKKLAESIKSIAILPFSNFTGDSEKDFLSAGIHDALISAMGQVGAIRVISRTSTLSYANSKKTMQQIASELNVDAIIEGSLLSADEIIRVQIKLINPFPDELQLWSQAYDVSLDNLLNVYGKMIQSIAKEVNITLSPEEEILLKKSRTVDSDAYEAYLKGKYSMGLLSQEGIQAAMGYFNQSIEIDPDFAPAYGGLAGIWAFLKQMDFVSGDDANPHIITNLNKAFDLDSTLADVYYWDAIKKVWTDFNWEGGEQAFLKSLELNPNFSECRALFSHLLMCLSRWDESKAQMMQALENDPNNPFIKVLHLILDMNLEEHDSVIVKAIPLQKNMPTNPLINLALIISYTRTEQYDLVVEQVKLKVELETDTSLSAYIEDLYREKGFKEAMNETAKTLESIEGVFVSAQTFQILYGMAENKDKFLEWIERGYIKRDPDMPYIGVNVYIHPFREEPRFQEILARMEFPTTSNKQ